MLPEDVKAQFVAALETRAARKARKERVAREKARVASERAAAEAKLKAKGQRAGWWGEEPGIYIRWCDGEHPWCPGPKRNGYSDYTWRAMVWCKERPCGNIYARLNIS